MAIQKLTYTGTAGQAVTEALSGFDVLNTSGGSMVFDSWAPRGAAVSLHSTGTATSGGVYGREAFTASDVIAIDVPVTVKALPSAELYFAIVVSGTGTTRCFALATTSTGLIRVRDAANTNAWSSAAGALAVDVPVIVSVYATRDATAGTFRVVVYEADGVTVRADSGLQTAKNTGAAAFQGLYLGAKASTSTVASEWLLGEPRWDTAATGLLPVWEPPVERSPAVRWNGTEYVNLDAYRWDGTGYVPLITP